MRITLLPLLLAVFALLTTLPVSAAQVKLLLPLERTSYQTNEQIDVSVVRTDAQALPADNLQMIVTGADGSSLQFTFPVAAVPVTGNAASATDHFKLNGWLLRPGAYSIDVAVNGATASAKIEIFSHIRKSTFRLIDWGSRAAGADITKLGEDGLGFNLIYGDYRLNSNTKNAEGALRGGADFMQCCTMSGAHQMDLRPECDWSDPLVIRGGTARAVQQAFIDRTKPNALGVHFYDEPGLTWWTHPKTGKVTPHNVPTQDAAFKATFGKDALQYNEVKPNDPNSVATWMFWGRWKESFMEGAWKDARFGVEQVNPRLISATQSVYGVTAYTDGYYFNVVRSLPVISGHGGYDDGAASYFYPSYHHELGRMRDLNKPNWYLPMWYGGMSPETFRLEQYLSFQTNLQGMAKPPDHQVHNPAGTPSAEGIVESNRLMSRLGTIFDTMPITRGEVALLYSLSQDLDAQIKSGMEDNYEGGGHTRGRLLSAYLAGKMIHVPFFPIVEEDVLDGTLAANHKAIVLAGINYLDLKVVAALEAFSKAGGKVLLTDDCQVQIPSGIKVGAEADLKQYKLINDLWATNQNESMRQRAAEFFMKANEPLAKVLQAKLQQAGIKPVLECDNSRVIITRQALGDIEYFFAVNATGDPAKSGLALKPATATMAFPTGPLYDAVRGGAVAELAKTPTKATFRFGPGEMRVFAHTARPIGGVQVGTPTLYRDYTLAESPISVTVTATLVDNNGKALVGSAPLEIMVIDPLGNTRYQLLRATDHGDLKLALPLAANDPAGVWTVSVTELLNNTTGTATFTYNPAPICNAAAGATQRAVCFGDERDNVYRFFRNHSAVTIVKGTSEFNNAAADRLQATLKLWGVNCTIVPAAEVNKPRPLTDEEAKTWVGLEFGKATAGTGNTPYKAGFAVQGPVVLLGNPQDNPLIAKVQEWGFLPYKASVDFPGAGRGYLAWQLDAVGIGQESLTLIAYDAAGMAEAAGTLYEAAAGLNPITSLTLPAGAVITPATAKPACATEAPIAWQVALPDRAVSLTAAANGDITAISWDGSASVISAGKVAASRPISATEVDAAAKETAVTVVREDLKEKLIPTRIVKRTAIQGGTNAIGYWGGTVQVFDGGNLKLQQMLPQDISAMVWTGNKLVVGLADGRVLALDIK